MVVEVVTLDTNTGKVKVWVSTSLERAQTDLETSRYWEPQAIQKAKGDLPAEIQNMPRYEAIRREVEKRGGTRYVGELENHAIPERRR